MDYYPRRITQTWTGRLILIVIAIAFLYGIWFNILDSIGYCKDKLKITCNEECHPVSIGDQFGGNIVYQPWNIIGHLIPGMILLWWSTPRKIELFVAGALISTIVMDSPIWGVIRLGHNLPLWYLYKENPVEFANTCDISKWIAFYYNPFGFYPIWDPLSKVPTAAILFWSIIGRAAGAVLLIWWQTKQERENKDFSLVKLIFRRRSH